VGKTSGVVNVLSHYFKGEYSYHECEEALHDSSWFLAQVQKALEEKKKIIVFDEIQKIENWSELVKLAWDQQKRKKQLIHWVLLGSSTLRLTQGASDSLAGRFEAIPVHHWNFQESKAAFDLSFENYLQYGGYPAAYTLLKDPLRMRKYLLDSIFESVVNRDIFRFITIKKPALFRQTFVLVSQYPAKEISYNKLLGQLQDAGNVDQVKHYLDLYSQAFLIRLIFNFSGTKHRTSSPKILPSAPVFTQLFLDRPLTLEEKGALFESLVGCRLSEHFENVFYWRNGNYEVDFVVKLKGETIGIEVKTKKRKASGLLSFKKTNAQVRTIIIDVENYEKFEDNPIAFIDKFAV
jgi:predicted AAA+ superfamily ATPase